MKYPSLLAVLLMVLVSLVLVGCGTEAQRRVRVDNGEGVVITYDTKDGGSQSQSTDKDMNFNLNKDGEIAFTYKTSSEKAATETNDPAEVVEAVGEAASEVVEPVNVNALIGDDD